MGNFGVDWDAPVVGPNGFGGMWPVLDPKGSCWAVCCEGAIVLPYWSGFAYGVIRGLVGGCAGIAGGSGGIHEGFPYGACPDIVG